MKRIQISIGDVFLVKISKTKVKFFQFIAKDSALMGGEVVRVFKAKYSIKEIPELEEIISDEVEFHTHTFIKLGVKSGYWEKFDNSSNVGKQNITFRTASDDEPVKVSSNWYIWKLGEEERIKIGRMKKKYENAEYGAIHHPGLVIERIKTGRNTCLEPK